MDDRTGAGWWAVAAQFSIMALILLAAALADWGPWWSIILGGLLVAAGGTAVAVTLIELGDARSVNPVPNGGRLRTDRMYYSMRHPIYSALLLTMLGVVLLRPSWFGLGAWALLVVVLTAKAIWEERMLAERFPEYYEYQRHTGRFIPRHR